MEEDDAATAPKKKIRRPDRVDGSRSPPETGLDLIGRLPDEVLGTIISLLPTKDGARTQAVSRRWRPLWRAAPLNLGAGSDLSGQDRKRVLLVSRILAKHPGPARRFALPAFRLRDRYAKVDGWLRSRALAGLQEIQLGYEIEDPRLPYPLPPSALRRFVPTLRAAEFGWCDFPAASEMIALPSSSLNFPCLKKLTLIGVSMSEEALHSMLAVAGCPVLESLLLEGNAGVGRLRISSPTVRSIGFSVSSYYRDSLQNPILLQELIIEDAPCLERLLPLCPNNGPATIRVMRAPKLEVLGLLSEGISKLEIGATVFQDMIAVSLTTSMRTVKVLALQSLGPNLDLVIDFLKCFPCLEKLYIMSYLDKDMKNKRSYNPLDPIECLEAHLKKVVVENYWGMRPDVDFAKFIVLNAKVLKKMVFRTFSNCNDKWMANQHRRLQLDNRASKGAQFTFRRIRWLAYPLNQHTHDLWINDPFHSNFPDR